MIFLGLCGIGIYSSRQVVIVRSLRPAPTLPGPPAVNQFELHVGMLDADHDVLAECAKLGTTVTAYAPLAKGGTLSAPAVAALAAKHNVSAAQVSLKWLLQVRACVFATHHEPADLCLLICEI